MPAPRTARGWRSEEIRFSTYEGPGEHIRTSRSYSLRGQSAVDVDLAWAKRPSELRSVDSYSWGSATWVTDLPYTSPEDVAHAVRAAPPGVVFLRIERWPATLNELAGLVGAKLLVPALVFDERILVGPALSNKSEAEVYVRRLRRDSPTLRALVDGNAELVDRPWAAFSESMLEALWRAPRRPAPMASYLVIDMVDGSAHWAQTAFAPDHSAEAPKLAGPASPVSAIAEVPKGLRPLHVVTAMIRGDRFGRGSAAARTEESARIRAAAEAVERSALRRLYVALRAGSARDLVPWGSAAPDDNAAALLRDALGNSTWDSTLVVCGTAVESTEHAAVAAARLEVIERRAVTTARWYSEIPDEALPGDYKRALARQNLSLRCWQLRSPLAGAAVLAELRGQDGYAYGVAAGFEHEPMLLHAIEEACLMFSHRSETRTLLPEVRLGDHGLTPERTIPPRPIPQMSPSATWTWSDGELRASGLILGLAIHDADQSSEQTLPSRIFEGKE